MILTSYTATLVSFLTVVNTELPFDDLDSLAAHGEYRLAVTIGSSWEALLKVLSNTNTQKRK